jgi:hypothetical protein
VVGGFRGFLAVHGKAVGETECRWGRGCQCLP